MKDSLNQPIGQYVYDGDGKRVKKIVPGTGEVTVFVYDASGKLIGEYSTVVQTGNDAKTVFTTNDHLGSPRINTDAIGQTISRHDYHPFGEEIARIGYGSDTIRKQFTGYERDSESTLDFAHARYLSANLGRFLSPDPVFGEVMRPQTWNAYAYVVSDPLNRVDLDGNRDALANVSSFVFRTIRPLFNVAYQLNISLSALLTISGYETGWGASNAFRNKNNPSGASTREVPHTYPTLDAGYQAFAGMLSRNFSDALGQTSATGFFDAIQDGTGYKYNSVNKSYRSLLSSLLNRFNLGFFDQRLMDPLRKGQRVSFGGVTYSSLSEVSNALNSANQTDMMQAQTFLFGAQKVWNDETRQQISQLGTEQDSNITAIRNLHQLPGSSEGRMAEELYLYRIEVNRFQNAYERNQGQ